ncbi:hypothetical protein ABBQ38_011655 [Trebouxia sp. C0009 RCD-2024]
MPKAHKDKRKRSRRDDEPAEYRLLTYAALGQTRKVAKLLNKHTDLDINFFDAHGCTALHQSHPGPNVEACNAQGQSIQTLAAAAMDVASDVSSDEAPTAARPSSKRVCPSPASDGAGQHWRTAADDLDAESEWQARLREESGAELRGGDEEDWDSYGGFFAEPSVAPAAFGPPEDEEEYARRIWQEMEKRKRQQSGNAASAARSYFEAETRANSAREQAAFDAAQRSRQILEEEKAKDRAWREAVLKGDVGSRRAKYEARWHTFATARESTAIKMADIPWLVEDLNQDLQQLTTFILYGAVTAEEQRRRSRAELMRWHPDKFVAKFGRRLDANDRHNILEKVKAISQLLNTVNAAV